MDCIRKTLHPSLMKSIKDELRCESTPPPPHLTAPHQPKGSRLKRTEDDEDDDEDDEDGSADASFTLREEKVNEMQVMLDALMNSDHIVVTDYVEGMKEHFLHILKPFQL